MLRRVVDISFAICLLIVTGPFLCFTALTLLIVQGAPVLFRQKRAGLNGAPFWMSKFRTMRLNAEKSGGTLTFSRDSRITPLGKILRDFKIDEFPQLLNVLRGDMTIVGPRPEVLDWVARYTPTQQKALSVKPGLTDPVQLLFRHEQDFLQSPAEYEILAPIKIQKQIDYIQRRTAWSDFLVILQTMRALFPSNPNPQELAIYEFIRTEAAEHPKTTANN